MRRNGILALTGDTSTGKTTLVNALLEDVDDDVIAANMVHLKIDLLGFLNLFDQAFQIPRRFDKF
jgi:type II secretory pathway predicted ATPase ExeA